MADIGAGIVPGVATQDERKAETRALLLDAAASLFARKGFHAVSIDAVAEAAGRTSGAVYAHFGGRDGLLTALLESWAQLSSAELGARLGELDLPDRLALIWHSVLTGPESQAGAWMLLEHELWLYGARHPEAGDAVARRYGVARRELASTISEWAERGEVVPQMDAESAGTLLLGLLLGLEMLHRVDAESVSDALATKGLAKLIGAPTATSDHSVRQAAPASPRGRG